MQFQECYNLSLTHLIGNTPTTSSSIDGSSVTFARHPWRLSLNAAQGSSTSNRGTTMASCSQPLVTNVHAHQLLPLPMATSLERTSDSSRIDTEYLTLFQPGCFVAQNYKRSKKNPSLPTSKKKELSYWQHDFICLAKTGQDKPPSPIEKVELVRASLGHKNLVFFFSMDPIWNFMKTYSMHFQS